MRTIGRYEICGLLGRGGMSLVYKVRLPVIEKIMALKLLHPHPILISLLGEKELKERFINEAVIMPNCAIPTCWLSGISMNGPEPHFLSWITTATIGSIPRPTSTR